MLGRMYETPKDLLDSPIYVALQSLQGILYTTLFLLSKGIVSFGFGFDSCLLNVSNVNLVIQATINFQYEYHWVDKLKLI